MDNDRRSDSGDRRARPHDLTETPLAGEVARRSRVEEGARYGVRTSCDHAAHKHCSDGSFEHHLAVVSVRDRPRRGYGGARNRARGNQTPPKKVTFFRSGLDGRLSEPYHQFPPASERRYRCTSRSPWMHSAGIGAAFIRRRVR